MIRSMTGYGSAKGTSGKLEISVELKSVNNRYLDCSIKTPRVYISFEEPMKSLVSKYISRGKVDVFVSIDSANSDDVEIKINRPLAEAYIAVLRDMANEYDLSGEIRTMDLSRFPDVLRAEKKQADAQQLCSDICLILEEAISDFNEMRAREGKRLADDIIMRLDLIESLTDAVEEISPKSVAEYRKKLETRMQEILQAVNIDEARILTEAALFADRVAINEETVRLRSHIAGLREMLESNEPIGRKIDFIVQEFNREANTIGSKGNDAEMAKVIVDMKAEIEKIREQAQNIE
ncbi:MAG: YicC family protein [Oscillospiraceae bacterium]|nr:YicC family protein [Oscillospiraceae bacterium]